MKKYLYRIIGLGFAVLAPLACSQKEEVLPENTAPESEAFQMKVSAGDPTTKTVIDEAGENYNILWQAGDKLGAVQKLNGALSLVESSPLASGGATAQFSFNLSGPENASYEHTFVYPSSALTKPAGQYLVSLPASQTFAANSFDPAADVLVSQHTQSATRPSSVEARFARLGGTARMVIKAPTTTESIQKIIFSTTEGVSLAGSYELNPANGELSDGITANGTNSITLTPAASTAFSGDVVVWFRLAEITLTDNFTVSVTTDKKTYTKTMYLSKLSRTLEFRNSKLVRFGIDMTDASGVTGLDNIRTDVINSAFTGVTENVFTLWGAKQGTKTGAYYKGRTATRTNGDFGLRTQNSNEGIVTTTSGGKVKSVTITIRQHKDPRSLEVYAKNTAYSNPEDVWNSETRGTLIGSVNASSVQDVTETVVFDTDYSYVGIKATGGAVNIPEISIAWEGKPIPEVTTNEASDIQYYSATLNGSFTNAAGGIYEAGFYWDTTAEALAANAHPTQFVTTDGTNNTSGSFSCELNSLNELTYYYYRAYVLWLNTETNTYQEFLGEIKSFQTTTRDYSAAGWLEMPAYTTGGMSGTTTSSLSDLYCVTHKATMGGTEQRNYTILYDPEMYASYWVAYPLCQDHLDSSAERGEEWGIFDPKIPAGKQVNLIKGYGVDGGSSNYYARGHQIPDADRKGVEAMQTQTYYPTNITPQLQYRFNGGIWMNLEKGVRSAIPAGDTLYVVTGAAFRKKGGSEDISIINPHNAYYTGAYTVDIPVPNYYWKVLLKVKRNGTSINGACAVGFWLEQGDDYSTANNAYESYATTVDQIEEWTGFDFFANLPAELQALCENSSDWTTFKNF